MGDFKTNLFSSLVQAFRIDSFVLGTQMCGSVPSKGNFRLKAEAKPMPKATCYYRISFAVGRNGDSAKSRHDFQLKVVTTFGRKS